MLIRIFFIFFFINHTLLAFNAIVTKDFEFIGINDNHFFVDRGSTLTYDSSIFTKNAEISSSTTIEKFRVNKEDYLEMFALTPPANFVVMDPFSARKEKLPEGMRISPVGETKEGKVNIALIDKNGTRVHINGSRKWYKPFYQITKAQYDELSSQFYIAHLDELFRASIPRPCPKPTYPVYIGKENISPDDIYKLSSIHYFYPQNSMSPRKQMLNLREDMSCSEKKTSEEERLLSESSWSNSSLEQRAQNIVSLSDIVLSELLNKQNNTRKTEISKMRIGKNRFFTKKMEGSIFSSLVTSELMSCVIFQETRGSLSPFAYNYNWCISYSAFGLSQTLKDNTFIPMFKENEGSMFPMTSEEGLKIAKITGLSNISSGEERGRIVFEAMSKSPLFQIEAVARVLNMKAKEMEINKLKDFDSSIQNSDQWTKDLISRYDGDDKEDYIPAVFNCQKCLKDSDKSEDSINGCYKKLVKDN